MFNVYFYYTNYKKTLRQYKDVANKLIFQSKLTKENEMYLESNIFFLFFRVQKKF